MKIYKFLEPLYIGSRWFDKGTQVYILKTGENAYWLSSDTADVYFDDKLYNELITKSIIELI